jgi:transcriptional regulator with PAS, ATPase and Fis domain
MEKPDMSATSTPATSSSASTSIVVLSDAGKIVFATGIGTNSVVQALANDREWIAELERKHLGVLLLNGRKLTVLWCKIDEGALLVFREGVGDTVFDFVAAVDFAYDIFEHLLSNPYDGMTVVDKAAIVRFISPIHERFFNHRRGEAIGMPVQKVIENTRLHTIVQTGKAEVGHIQKMRGDARVVSRTPISRNGEVLGAIGRVMFKGPRQLDELNQRINSLENEVAFYKREAEAARRSDYSLDSIIGESSRMRDLKKDIVRVAPLDVPLLVMGESGVGKELVAQAIHRLSGRRMNAMVMINAAALPATLVESELFGYSAGAFTGANQKGHPGKFEQANGGTLFLDEIGDMPLEVQAKLLRVLQDGSVEKLGGTKPIKVDFRLVSATNRDLEAMIADNQFRLDLFYRISPVVLRVPPLRERLDDIPLLAERFLADFAKRHDRAPCKLPGETVAYLQTGKWPGNIRQLKHELERAAIFNTSDYITPADLRIDQRDNEDFAPVPALSAMPPEALTGTLAEQLERVEKRSIERALEAFNGNKKQVAKELNISRSYLYKKLADFGLE